MNDLLSMTNEAPIGRNWHTVQVAPITPSAETLRNIEAIGSVFSGTVALQRREAQKAWLRDWDQMVRLIKTGEWLTECGFAIYSGISKHFEGSTPTLIGAGIDGHTSINVGEVAR